MKTFLPLLFLSFTLCCSVTSSAQNYTPTGNVLYVKKGGSGNESGASWGHAIPELADALKWVYDNSASWLDNPIRIYVAKGTYYPKFSPEDGAKFGTDQGRENSFYIGPNTQLFGGFDPENNISDLGHTRIFGPGGSILSGDFGENDQISGQGATLQITGNDENAYHVVLITSTWLLNNTFGKNAIIDGFTISGGNANGTRALLINQQTVASNGGAGLSADGFYSLTLNDLIVTGNAATDNGGGLRCNNLLNEEGHRSVFSRLTITRNAAGFGGGMYFTIAYPTVAFCTISGNWARNDGGGVRNYWSSASEYHIDSNPLFSEVTISGNHAGRDGGGMANSLMSPTLQTVTISQNTSGRNGGGMYNYDRSHTRLTGVRITGNTAQTGGGGMYNYTNCSPVIRDVIIDLNTTSGSGGGLYNRSGSSPVLNDVTIDRNTATLDGGGMFSEGGAASSSPTLNRVEISANGASRNGGGLFFSSQSLAKLTDVTITQNTAVNFGGGTYITGGQPEFQTATISRNTASSGGGMFNASNASPLLRDVEITENIAGATATSGAGGGVYNQSASPIFLSVVIRANAAGSGGGIMNNSTSGLYVNVLIAGNTAGINGGGIYNWTYSRPVLLNTTLAGNKSEAAGGAIYNNQNATFSIRNTIIWGNSDGIAYASTSIVPTITYSLVQGRPGTDGGNIEASGIPENGSTLFMAPFSHTQAPTAQGDYTLKPGTPVMNRGNKAYYEHSETDLLAQYLASLGITADLAGNPRQYGPQMDMGAYELIHESALPVKLAAFNATLLENSVRLTWHTTEEINASHFEVERSHSAQSFEKVGRIDTKGSAKGLANYSFTDNPVTRPIWYYRLKMVDLDGSFTYSPILSVSNSDTDVLAGAALYPNPATGQTVRLLDSSGLEPLSIRVFNAYGKQVEVSFADAQLHVAHLPPGMYLVRLVYHDGTSRNLKLLKE